MCPNPLDLFRFTLEILNGKVQFLYSERQGLTADSFQINFRINQKRYTGLINTIKAGNVA